MKDYSEISLTEKLGGKFVAIPHKLFTVGINLTPEAKWIYATLRSFTNNKTDKTFPSYEKIMERSGMKRNAVAKALKELEAFCWIDKRKHFGKSTDYDLFTPEWSSNQDNPEGPQNTDPIPTEEMAKKYKLELSRKRKANDPTISAKVGLLNRMKTKPKK